MQDSQSTALDDSSGRPDSAAEPSIALRWWVIFLTALVCLLDGYDMVVAPISVPVIAEGWELKAEAFTGMLTAGVLGIALGAAFIAPLGDRFGRRPLIIFSFALVGLASLLTAISDTTIELMFYRLITGLGLGASLANALAQAAEFPIPGIRSRTITVIYSMSAVGSVAGGLVAPPLLAAFDWRGLYVFGGVIPLLLVPLLYFTLPESRHFLQVRRTADILRLAGHAPVKRANGVAKLLAQPYRAKTLFLWTLFFLVSFIIYVISSWLPTLMRLYGWSIANSVYAIMVFSFGGIVGGFLLGWLVDKGRNRLCLMVGFVISGLAMAALNVVPSIIWIWMTLIALMGAGMIGVLYSSTALAAIVYPTELRAGGIGTAGAMGRAGATVAPAAGGFLLAQGFTALHIFNSLIGPLVIGFVVVAAFSRLFNMRPEAALAVAESTDG